MSPMSWFSDEREHPFAPELYSSQIPRNHLFSNGLKASFKNTFKARALVSEHRPLCYQSNELFRMSNAPESHSTISCEYSMCSSDVLTIRLFEIWSFQFFELAGGRRRDALANCMRC
eukprot:scaffold5734_cov145-Skeletonema_marinoi.AAC.1